MNIVFYRYILILAHLYKYFVLMGSLEGLTLDEGHVCIKLRHIARYPFREPASTYTPPPGVDMPFLITTCYRGP